MPKHWHCCCNAYPWIIPKRGCELNTNIYFAMFALHEKTGTRGVPCKHDVMEGSALSYKLHLPAHKHSIWPPRGTVLTGGMYNELRLIPAIQCLSFASKHAYHWFIYLFAVFKVLRGIQPSFAPLLCFSLGAEQNQLSFGSTGTSSGSCQETETCIGLDMSDAMTASPKLFFKAPWRVGDAMVGRGNAGWTTSKSGHPCPCQTCSRRPAAEKTGRASLPNRLSCPPDDPIGKGTELNWTVL